MLCLAQNQGNLVIHLDGGSYYFNAVSKKIALAYLSHHTNLSDALLQRPQGCLVGNDAGSNVENVASSVWRELHGSCMVHAGGTGGCGQADGIGWTVGCDTHPAAALKLAAQHIILSLCIL